MTDTKQRLREIRKSCDLGPLKTAEALDRYWVDTDNARDALQNVFAYFATYTETWHETDARAGNLSAGAKASTPSLLADLLSLFVDFKAEVRYEARNETNRVSKIRKRPGDLIANANILVNAVRQSLPLGQRLLFIVEDLDKLDIAIAREVFIERPTILTSLAVSIIYTIPIFTFHSPDASLLQRQFHHTFTLPMIKTIGPDGAKAEGFDVVRDILTRRLGNDALTSDALDLLIEKTGGVLQHAFEVIVTATLFRNAAVPLEKEQIQHSLQRKKAEMRNEITLPYDPVPGLERPEQLYDRLKQCLEQQQNGKPCQPSGLMIDQVLLKSCALVEYNGARWLGVHPLVQEILIETGVV